MQKKKNQKNIGKYIGLGIVAFFAIILLISIITSDTNLTRRNNSSASSGTSTTAIKATIKDDSQSVEINVLPSSYTPIIVQKGIPVKFNLKTQSSNLTGCNNGIKIKEYEIAIDLKEGDNIVEFTPNETGTFTYTCWMGMLSSTITVVEDLNNVDSNIINSISEAQKSNVGGSCGCGGAGN